MNKLVIFLILNIFVSTSNLFSQTTGIGINSTGAPANSKALLDIDVRGMNQKAGLLLPRMNTADRNNIPTPIPESLLIYNTDTHCFEAYYNGIWVAWGCLSDCKVLESPKESTSLSYYTEIVWNWDTVSGATGYKWNTVDDYSTSISVFPSSNTTFNQSGLTCNTTYKLYLWAYNSCGNSSTSILIRNTSICPSSCYGITKVIDIDGNTYDTVSISTQCWMKEDLKTSRYKDGTAIPNVTDNTTWANLSSGAYCNYNNDSNNANTYGFLYNWFAVNDSRKLCPLGWHVPSHDEWTTLERALCSSGSCVTDFPYDIITLGFRGTDEGGKLKETGITLWFSPNTGATNSSGFTALPNGSRYLSAGLFVSLGTNGNWWSSTEYNGSQAWFRTLLYNTSNIYRFTYVKGYGFSVRCLKD